MKIILIRHGLTQGNAEKRYIGKTDEGLCDEGKDILIANKISAVYPEVQLVYISPMRRCEETAAILYPDKEVQKVELFREIDFGDFEGKNYLELHDNPSYVSWLASGGSENFPNGESRENFQNRCVEGFISVCRDLNGKVLKGNTQTKGENEASAALIVHGGTIMSVLSAFCGGDYFDYQIANGAFYECELTEDREQIHLKILGKSS